VLTNLGDGVAVLALPWLATILTRDPMGIATVTAAGYLPWLLFAIPAGVVTNLSDRRKRIARRSFWPGFALGLLGYGIARLRLD
jgi:hypothetical protein